LLPPTASSIAGRPRIIPGSRGRAVFVWLYISYLSKIGKGNQVSSRKVALLALRASGNAPVSAHSSALIAPQRARRAVRLKIELLRC